MIDAAPKLNEFVRLQMCELPPLDIHGARRLLKGGFGAELRDLVFSYTTSLSFGVVETDGEAVFNSATGFFLNTTKKSLLITAKHVYEEYLRKKYLNAELRFQVGNMPFVPEDALAGIGDRVDIASFEFSADLIQELGKNTLSIWPPDPPNYSGTGIVHAGFPRAEMVKLGPRTGIFGLYASIGALANVTDRQIVCDIDWDESFSIASTGPMPPRNFDTGGMSGGPMLSIRERKGILSFPLAGVISEGFAERDRLIGERADNIRADGSIRG